METKFVCVSIDTLESIKNDILEIKNSLQNNTPIHPNKLPDWIKEKEVMELLGIKATSLYQLRKSGKLLASKTRPIFYSLNSVNEYLKSRI